MTRIHWLSGLIVGTLACSSEPVSTGGGVDASMTDTAPDVAVEDASVPDTSPPPLDVSPPDAPDDCVGKTLETCRCVDDAACAVFASANLCEGRLVCRSEKCVIDPSTVVSCDTSKDPPCRTSKCNPSTGACALAAAPVGTRCDDGAFCTVDDQCAAGGVCVGSPRTCDLSCQQCDESTDACALKPSSCVIEGACFKAGDLAPGRPCLECAPETTTTAWTPRAVGTTCPVVDTLCSVSASCSGTGACVSAPRAPAAPTPTAPLHGRLRTRKPQFRWTFATCATSYELQVDDSCGTTPTTCAFASPEVDVTGITVTQWQPTTDLPIRSAPPVSTQYVWRVRACNGSACSAWANGGTFRVGGVDKDVDGDGYSDVVVGAPGNASYVGRAYVFRGGATGTSTTASTTLVPPGGVASGSFGNAITIGDVNGDGFADVIVADHVSYPSATWGSTRISVYPGGPSGPSPSPSMFLDSPPSAAWVDAPFNDKIYAGSDLDGDGYADLVVAAIQGGTAPPSAYIFRGSAAGLATTPSWTIPNTKPSGYSNYRDVVGFAAEGDFTGDGLPDIVIAHHPELTGDGEMQLSLYRGVLGGAPVLVNTMGVTELFTYERLADHVLHTAGDYDGDGLADLLFAADRYTAGRSQDFPILAFRGKSTLVASYAVELTATVDAYFGSSLVVADFDGDGRTDVVVGAKGNPSKSVPGRAYFYKGTITSTTLPTIMKNDSADSGFGAKMELAGDVNGDGYPDVVIGAPGYRDEDPGLNQYSDCGRTYVFFGGSSGLAASPSVTLRNPGFAWAGQFGKAIGY